MPYLAPVGAVRGGAASAFQPQPQGERNERIRDLHRATAAAVGRRTGGVGNIVGPLIIWLVKKDSLAFAAGQAKEALNFNITLLIIGVILLLVTIFTFGLGIFITAPIGILLGIAWLVLTIIAAMKANEGVAYRYPFTLRLVK